MVQRIRTGKVDAVSDVPVKDRLLAINCPAQRISVDSARADSIAKGGDSGGMAELSGSGKGSGKGIWHELLSELMYLEATSAYWALQAANPVDLDYQELQRSLQSSQVSRVGETACAEYLTCLQCFHCYFVQGTVQIEPCQCGCDYFAIGRRH